MKKTLLIMITVFAAFAANAQWLGTTSSCIPQPLQQPGFLSPDSTPCAVQGVAYNYSIPFQMYTQFTYLGTHQIDSVTYDTIYNLPCGLFWSLNKASRTYVPNENGCLTISGTTNDVVGQYNFRIQITAYLSGGGGTGETIYPGTVDAAGIKIWLRVAGPNGAACAPVDTSANATDQTANPVCHGVGINEIEANLTSINIMPNPINTSAVLSFVAEKSASYAVKITDVTGKVIMVKQMEANAGVNTSTIERGNLASGMYLLSLSDGVSTVIKKFTVVE